MGCFSQELIMELTLAELRSLIAESEETKVLRTLRKLEEHMATQASALATLKSDMAVLQTNYAALAQSVTDANARLQAIIDGLKQSVAVNDAVDLAALSTSLEAVNATLGTEAAAEGAVGQPTKLTVSPMTANVAPGGKISFSANVAVTWKATSGQIDATGVYTAPASGSTSDTVTATSTDASAQVVTASITIG
jgi:hypothetical protein